MPIVGLNCVNSERKFAFYIVYEFDCVLLIMLGIDFKSLGSSRIGYSGNTDNVLPVCRTYQQSARIDIDLNSMSRNLLFVSLKLLHRSLPLVLWKLIKAVAPQYVPNSNWRYLNVTISL